MLHTTVSTKSLEGEQHAPPLSLVYSSRRAELDALQAQTTRLSRPQIDEAQALWEGNVLTDYSYTATFHGAFGETTVEFSVRGERCSARLGQSRIPGFRKETDFDYCSNYSIPKVFERLRQTIAEPNWQAKATFDPVFGYPTKFYEGRLDLFDFGPV